jgi:hypothetical protein
MRLIVFLTTEEILKKLSRLKGDREKHIGSF